MNSMGAYYAWVEPELEQEGREPMSVLWLPRADVTQEFYDYKKFTVDTSVSFQGVKP